MPHAWWLFTELLYCSDNFVSFLFNLIYHQYLKNYDNESCLKILGICCVSIIIAFRVNISQWPNKTAHTSAVNQNSYVVSEWKVLCKKKIINHSFTYKFNDIFII